MPKRFAINDSSASPEVTRQGPEIQPFILFPGSGGDDAGSVGAYILCKGLLRGMPDIETAEIHSYLERGAFFQTASNGLHGTPRVLAKFQENGCRGGNDKAMIRLEKPQW